MSRLLTGSLAALVLLPVGLAVPAPAQAALRSSNVHAEARAGSLEDCTVASPGTVSKSQTVSDNGAWWTATASASTSVVDPDDAGDTSTATASTVSRARVTTAKSTFRRAELLASAQARVQSAQGSGTSCRPFGTTDGGAVVDISVARTGWLDLALDVDSTGGVLQDGYLELLTSQAYGAPKARLTSTGVPATMRVPVEPGTYFLSTNVHAFASTPNAAPSTTALRGTVTFTEAGSASTRAVGPATRFVRLPERRTCREDVLRARITWKKQVRGEVAKIQMSVPGVRTATARRPVRGQPLMLRKLPAGRDLAVEVTVTLESGKVLEARRSYLRCR